MADNNDYKLDLSVGSNGIIDELNKTINKIDEVNKKTESLSTEMSKGFEEAAQANRKTNETIVVTSKVLDDAKKKYEDVGKSITKAFDETAVKSMQKNIENFSDKVKDISIKRKLEFEVDQKSYAEIQKMSDELKSKYAEMQSSLDGYAQKLNERNADVAETISFNNEQIEILTGKLKGLEDQFKTSAPGVLQASIVKQIKEVNNELEFQKMELEQSKGSYKAYQEEIKKVADTQKQLTDSLVLAQRELNAKAAAEKKAEEQIKKQEQATDKAREAEEKRNAEMNNTNSILGVLDTASGGMVTKLKDIIGVSQGVTKGFNNIRLALISTGIGAFVVLLGSLIAYFKRSEEGQDKFAYYMDIIGAVTGKVMDLLADFGELIISVFENPKQAIKDLGNFLVENITNRLVGIVEFLPKMAEALKLVFEGEFTKAGEVALNAVGKVGLGIEDTTSKMKGLSSATAEWASETKKAAIEAGEISKLRASITVAERELLIEQANANKQVAELREKAAQKDIYSAKERVKFLQDAAKIEDGISEKRIRVAKMQEDAQVRSNAISKSTTEDLNKEAEAKAKVIELDAERARKQRALQRELQANINEERTKAEAARKERLQAEQKTNENLLKYLSAYEDSVISLMEDGTEKRLKIINKDYDNKIASLKLETLRTVEEIEARNKLIEQLELQRAHDLLEAERKYQHERLAIQLEARSIYANLQKDSLNNDLELLEIDHAQRLAKINELFKDEEETRIRLVNALEESTGREKQAILDKWYLKELETQEKIQTLTIEMLYNSGKKGVQAEFAKNVEILKVQKEFAQKYLDNLVDDGTEESKVRILEAKKRVNDLDNALIDITKNRPPMTFFDLLGIDLGDDGEQINKALGEIYSNIQTMTNLIVDQYDRQIQARKEAVNEIDKDINSLEKQLDKEKELRERGFANNVELLEKELQEKQMQREEELRQMEELNEKRKAIQKAQFILDTAVQAQNLITASTNIFNSLSSIPFVGVPLAIALIGTMFGAFAMTKIKAAEVVNSADVSKYEKGGLLDGKSHSAGGVKYYSEDGANIKELEGGEYVTNKKQTAKFLPLLEAINNDRFHKGLASEISFINMLDSMGIKLQENSIDKALNVVNQIDELKVVINQNGETATYKEMLFYLKRIDEYNRENSTQYWEEQGKKIVKRGNKTTIIHLEDGED